MNLTPSRSDAPGIKVIRSRLRGELPAQALKSDPKRLFWAAPLAVIALIGWWAILSPLEAWWSKLTAAMVIAHCLGALVFLGHEVMHGAMGGSRKLQNAVAWLGFGPIIVPPNFWRAWHNRMHHGNTNHKVNDPDHFGTLGRYKKPSLAKRLLSYSPGTGHPLSYVFCCYNFSLHSNVLLWTLADRHPMLKDRRWVKERAQTVALMVGWLALALYSGWDALYTVLVPLAGANLMTQIYIVTNHALRPLTRDNNPLENAMSLKVPKWIDKLHFHFSHHTEHHLMPGMASNHLPKVRQWLLKESPGSLALMGHGEALWWLYQTPRTYRTNHQLASLNEPDHVFDLLAFGDYLTSDMASREAAEAKSFWHVLPSKTSTTP